MLFFSNQIFFFLSFLFPTARALVNPTTSSADYANDMSKYEIAAKYSWNKTTTDINVALMWLEKEKVTK